MNKIGKDERPTMERVAALAGVSKITVSRALRGSDLVRPEVRTRIAEIANQVGYRMNVAARSLRTRETRTIAVVIDQIDPGRQSHTDPLILSIIGGLLETLTPAGYSTLLTTNEHFLSSSAVGADGAVMLGQGEGAHRVTQVSAMSLPIVAWGEPVPGVSVKVVGSDNRMGGKLAAGHLVARGAARLLFLGDVQHPEIAARLEGFREALASSEARLVDVLPCPFTAEGGAAAVGGAIDAGMAFDAIFAASDSIAAGACDALSNRGISVPDEIAIVGFDDAPVASVHRPSISSIRQDGAEAGRALGQAVIDLIEKRAVPAAHALPVELVPRETSR
ncbi:DNA-binding LacI/PurR family transcriptional regulator [Sphingopyxis panaciterrae]|uniref:substrate-binding domain-containing protein n=1 Tax=Sphingopyxis panaciterrae TaxID=363841 RepID=UPI0014247190|nr:substrate-binding domain-containing protein [Sphingopyxis panaciterrae]NIJ39709.1 DNA-binding LacI/PurR family transcriptional regulator [Sphingopyxis panaciterrae]